VTEEMKGGTMHILTIIYISWNFPWTMWYYKGLLPLSFSLSFLPKLVSELFLPWYDVFRALLVPG